MNFWLDIERNEYTVVTLNSSTKYVRSYVRGENIQYSKKVSEEYIEKLKHTNQCQRMWIQRHHRSRPSIMATFSRGRLANQLNSFAYQYAIWKVNIRFQFKMFGRIILHLCRKYFIPFISKIFYIAYVENHILQ